MDEKFRIVLTGGGSGGHIYPLLAVADEIARKSVEMQFACEMTYLGARDSYAPLFEGRGITISPIATGKMRRYFSLENLFDVPKFFIGFIQALWKLYRIMPDAIFSKRRHGRPAGSCCRLVLSHSDRDTRVGRNTRPDQCDIRPIRTKNIRQFP